MSLHLCTVSSKLLGRDVDLNKLLSQRMNEALHKSLDIAISRFEDGDITGIMVWYTLRRKLS